MTSSPDPFSDTEKGNMAETFSASSPLLAGEVGPALRRDG